MFTIENKENDAKSQDERATKLWGEASHQKVRRSVLKEFDPFAPDSPCPEKIPQPRVDEEEIFEDAETSLTSFICPINKSTSEVTPSRISFGTRESLLIPELKDCRPGHLLALNDTGDLSYMECVENLSQINDSQINETSSEDDFEFNYKPKPNVIVNQSPKFINYSHNSHLKTQMDKIPEVNKQQPVLEDTLEPIENKLDQLDTQAEQSQSNKGHNVSERSQSRHVVSQNVDEPKALPDDGQLNKTVGPSPREDESEHCPCTKEQTQEPVEILLEGDEQINKTPEKNQNNGQSQQCGEETTNQFQSFQEVAVAHLDKDQDQIVFVDMQLNRTLGDISISNHMDMDPLHVENTNDTLEISIDKTFEEHSHSNLNISHSERNPIEESLTLEDTAVFPENMLQEGEENLGAQDETSYCGSAPPQNDETFKAPASTDQDIVDDLHDTEENILLCQVGLRKINDNLNIPEPPTETTEESELQQPVITSLVITGTTEAVSSFIETETSGQFNKTFESSLNEIVPTSDNSSPKNKSLEEQQKQTRDDQIISCETLDRNCSVVDEGIPVGNGKQEPEKSTQNEDPFNKTFETNSEELAGAKNEILDAPLAQGQSNDVQNTSSKIRDNYDSLVVEGVPVSTDTCAYSNCMPEKVDALPEQAAETSNQLNKTFEATPEEIVPTSQPQNEIPVEPLAPVQSSDVQNSSSEIPYKNSSPAVEGVPVSSDTGATSSFVSEQLDAEPEKATESLDPFNKTSEANRDEIVPKSQQSQPKNEILDAPLAQRQSSDVQNTSSEIRDKFYSLVVAGVPVISDNGANSSFVSEKGDAELEKAPETSNQLNKTFEATSEEIVPKSQQSQSKNDIPEEPFPQVQSSEVQNTSAQIPYKIGSLAVETDPVSSDTGVNSSFVSEKLDAAPEKATETLDPFNKTFEANRDESQPKNEILDDTGANSSFVFKKVDAEHEKATETSNQLDKTFEKSPEEIVPKSQQSQPQNENPEGPLAPVQTSDIQNTSSEIPYKNGSLAVERDPVSSDTGANSSFVSEKLDAAPEKATETLDPFNKTFEANRDESQPKNEILDDTGANSSFVFKKVDAEPEKATETSNQLDKTFEESPEEIVLKSQQSQPQSEIPEEPLAPMQTSDIQDTSSEIPYKIGSLAVERVPVSSDTGANSSFMSEKVDAASEKATESSDSFNKTCEARSEEIVPKLQQSQPKNEIPEEPLAPHQSSDVQNTSSEISYKNGSLAVERVPVSSDTGANSIFVSGKVDAAPKKATESSDSFNKTCEATLEEIVPKLQQSQPKNEIPEKPLAPVPSSDVQNTSSEMPYKNGSLAVEGVPFSSDAEVNPSFTSEKVNAASEKATETSDPVNKTCEATLEEIVPKLQQSQPKNEIPEEPLAPVQCSDVQNTSSEIPYKNGSLAVERVPVSSDTGANSSFVSGKVDAAPEKATESSDSFNKTCEATSEEIVPKLQQSQPKNEISEEPLAPVQSSDGQNTSSEIPYKNGSLAVEGVPVSSDAEVNPSFTSEKVNAASEKATETSDPVNKTFEASPDENISTSVQSQPKNEILEEPLAQEETSDDQNTSSEIRDKNGSFVVPVNSDTCAYSNCMPEKVDAASETSANSNTTSEVGPDENGQLKNGILEGSLTQKQTSEVEEVPTTSDIVVNSSCVSDTTAEASGQLNKTFEASPDDIRNENGSLVVEGISVSRDRDPNSSFESEVLEKAPETSDQLNKTFEGSPDGILPISHQLQLKNEIVEEPLEEKQINSDQSNSSEIQDKNCALVIDGVPISSDRETKPSFVSEKVDVDSENPIDNVTRVNNTFESGDVPKSDQSQEHSEGGSGGSPDIRNKDHCVDTVNTSFVVGNCNKTHANVDLETVDTFESSANENIAFDAQSEDRSFDANTDGTDLKAPTNASFIIAEGTDERDAESEMAVEVLAQSLNQTIDVEESAIAEDLDSTDTSSGNVNVTIGEVDVELDVPNPESVPANNELVDHAASAVTAEDRDVPNVETSEAPLESNQTEAENNVPIKTETPEEPDGDHKETREAEVENPLTDVNKTESEDTKPKPRPKIECRPNIRSLRHKTQVITNPLLLKSEPKANEANEQLFEEYKKKSDQLKHDIDRLQSDLDKIQEENMRTDQCILGHAMNREAVRDNILKYKILIQEYEKHITKQCEELCLLKKQSEKIARHFTSTEMAFSEVFEKYERAKTVIGAYKRNEEILSDNIKNAEFQLTQLEVKCKAMEDQCNQDVKHAQEQVDQEKETYKQNIAKLQAMVKRLQIKASSLETSLKQKTEECQALASLCDDITGGHPA